MSRLPHLQVDRHRDTKTLTPKRYHVLQCVAVCCSMLQCVAVCCSVLQCAAVCFKVWCRLLEDVMIHYRGQGCIGQGWPHLSSCLRVAWSMRGGQGRLLLWVLCHLTGFARLVWGRSKGSLPHSEWFVYCLFVRRDAQMGNECWKWRLSLHWLIVELIYWEQ